VSGEDERLPASGQAAIDPDHHGSVAHNRGAVPVCHLPISIAGEPERTIRWSLGHRPLVPARLTQTTGVYTDGLMAESHQIVPNPVSTELAVWCTRAIVGRDAPSDRPLCGTHPEADPLTGGGARGAAAGRMCSSAAH
jgi:hypothetical protein